MPELSFTIEPALDHKSWRERGDVQRLRVAGYEISAIIHPDDPPQHDVYYVRLRCRWDSSDELSTFNAQVWRKTKGYLSAQIEAIRLITTTTVEEDKNQWTAAT